MSTCLPDAAAVLAFGITHEDGEEGVDVNLIYQPLAPRACHQSAVLSCEDLESF
jgi:hypothetical protein